MRRRVAAETMERESQNAGHTQTIDLSEWAGIAPSSARASQHPECPTLASPTGCTSGFPAHDRGLPPTNQTMSTVPRLSEAQKAYFAKNGYLILRDTLSSEEQAALIAWTQEVKTWPDTPGSSKINHVESSI